MTAQIYIIVNEAKNALLVPSTVIQEKRSKGKEKGKAATGKFVRVLKEDGTVEERTVEVGIDNRVNAQILSGLKEGEEVIISEESGKKSGSGRIPGGPRM